MRLRLRHLILGAGLLAVAVTLCMLIVLPLLPDYSHNIPAEARGRFAGHWVLESAPSAELAAGRKTLAIETHPPHLGSGRSYVVTWENEAIPVRSQLRPPSQDMKRCGMYLAYEDPRPQAGSVSGEGLFINLFTDGSPDDDEGDDLVYVDLRPEDQVRQGLTVYSEHCLLYVRADS